MKHPTWFGRFKVYPISCILHIAQGAGAGALAATGHWPMAIIWLACYIAYQGLSFARKVNTEGRGDTAGLDAFDFLVGALPAYLAVILLEVV